MNSVLIPAFVFFMPLLVSAIIYARGLGWHAAFSSALIVETLALLYAAKHSNDSMWVMIFALIAGILGSILGLIGIFFGWLYKRYFSNYGH